MNYLEEYRAIGENHPELLQEALTETYTRQLELQQKRRDIDAEEVDLHSHRRAISRVMGELGMNVIEVDFRRER